MIKFFRKIRKKLLIQNRISKYMLYAIGEIILVVIGILIAIQINQAYNKKLDRNQEKYYLSQLMEDLNLDLATIKTEIETDSIKEVSSNYILEHFKNPIPNNDSLLIRSLAESIPGSSLVNNGITFNEIKSSGKLSLISNDTLRKKIQRYYQELELAIEVINFNVDLGFKDYFPNLMNGKYDMNSVINFLTNLYGQGGFTEIDEFDSSIFYRPSDDPESKKLIDGLSLNIMLAKFNLNRFKKCRERAQDLKTDIQTYLDNNE